MAPTPSLDHNAVLRAAARGALAPLGLTQRGRSRTWTDDRGWYLIVVEFQPSSGAKGSYLNVDAMWLWHEKDYLSLDYGTRVAGFQPVEADWAAQAARLSDLAATRVLELRRELPDVRAAARVLIRRKPAIGWPMFHAAVASGLAGDRRTARTLMTRLLAMEVRYDWERAMHAKVQAYRDLLDSETAFRARVADEVERTRARLMLPPADEPIFSM